MKSGNIDGVRCRLAPVQKDAAEPRDAVAFARSLAFHPDEMQALVLKDARRGLLNCTRQWGKSTVTAMKAVHRAHQRPGTLTIVVSPSARQTGEFLRKAATFVRALKIKPRGDGDNEMSLALPNGSRIVGLPGTEGTVRGFSAVSLLLIDEAARVSDEMYKAVRPMLAVGGGDLWLMSTPFGKRGFFYEEWSHGGDIWQRISVPASKCPRISKEFLDEERAALGDLWFRQEYCCEFLDDQNGLFRGDAVDRAFRDDIQPLFGSRI